MTDLKLQSVDDRRTERQISCPTLRCIAAGVLVVQCSHNKPATITSWMRRMVVDPKSCTSS